MRTASARFGKCAPTSSPTAYPTSSAAPTAPTTAPSASPTNIPTDDHISATDSDWPGQHPAAEDVLTLNVRTDRYPRETKWTWSGVKWKKKL